MRAFLEAESWGVTQTLNNMYHRWTPEMETDFLKQHHWRKSSQWVTLRYAMQYKPHNPGLLRC